MAPKAKMIGQADTQPETAVEERAALLHPTREQRIRIRAYEIYLGRGEQPGFELGIGFSLNVSSLRKRKAQHESELSQHLRGESIPMGRHRELTGGQGRALRKRWAARD